MQWSVSILTALTFLGCCLQTRSACAGGRGRFRKPGRSSRLFCVQTTRAASCSLPVAESLQHMSHSLQPTPQNKTDKSPGHVNRVSDGHASDASAAPEYRAGFIVLLTIHSRSTVPQYRVQGVCNSTCVITQANDLPLHETGWHEMSRLLMCMERHGESIPRGAWRRLRGHQRYSASFRRLLAISVSHRSPFFSSFSLS